MGLFANFISYWANGESADDLQARNDAEDAALAKENDADADFYGPDWKHQVDAHVVVQKQQDNDVGGQIDDAGIEGLNAGAANVRGALTGTLGSILKVVPWWAWLVLIVAVWFQLGGFHRVRKVVTGE